MTGEGGPPEQVAGIDVHRGGAGDGEALQLAMGAALPVGFRLQADEDRLTITRRVRSRGLRWLTTTTVAIDAVAVLLTVAGGLGVEVVMTLAIYVPMVAILNYLTLAGWLNRRRLIVDHQGVRTRDLPLPLLRVPALDRRAIERLAIEDDGYFTAAGRKVEQWRVVAHARDRRAPITLLGGLPERAQAEHVQRTMERFLALAR